jgi:hypothetical protein
MTNSLFFEKHHEKEHVANKAQVERPMKKNHKKPPLPRNSSLTLFPFPTLSSTRELERKTNALMMRIHLAQKSSR